MIIREATKEDLEKFWGRIPPVSVRAIVADNDGVIEGVAGITLEKGLPTAFSEVREGCEVPKRTRFTVAKQMADWMKPFRPIAAIEKEASDKFLLRMGFKPIAERQNIKVYRL